MVGHVVGTGFEDFVKCLEKCLENVCNVREFGERFWKRFLKVWKIGNDVITYLKV